MWRPFSRFSMSRTVTMRHALRSAWEWQMVADASVAQGFQARIHDEQIELLFRYTPLAQMTNLTVATVLVGFLWRVIDPDILLGWWAAVAVVVLFRLGLTIAYRRRAAGTRIAWHTLMTAGAVLSGVTWGAAGVLFFVPESAVTLVFLTIILAGMSAGTIASHSSWPPAQFSYAILTMTPIAVCYLLEGSELWILGLMCLIYLVNVLAFARQLSRTLLESMRLRLENQELVQQLREEMSAAEVARARAEDANLAKSKFLAAASHDLRQPLQAMNLFIEALRTEKDPVRAERARVALGDSAQALEGLLNDLLDISRLEAGLFSPRIRIISLQALFDGLQRELQPLAEEKGIELGFVRTRLKVASDPSMLGRILRNIITNAIRYTEQGAVLVGCRRKGDQVAIALCDTGPGIEPEFHKAIFREFYQLGNPERDRQKGLGLGLAIVDGLCRILDHPLELKSRVGHGSTFSVHVPSAAGDLPCLDDTEETASSGLRGFAVVVVDDDLAIREALAEVLCGWGCHVLTAESAGDALSQLADAAFSPDAIIADYRLREGRSGTEAIAGIRRALGRDVPAAILTGDTAPERLREASASGLLLLHKPVQPSRLRAVLSRWHAEAVGALHELA
ncbi:hybrid sensor histidine kinase/response regulator [Parazoarcus communis]|uniref:histidine kinase n=2 Tax=Parazoarcus communis TaxID=41977 RepID=A0A2U8H561_9RHOO|nr:hybrid sensor histidine kinase/response regulator [Parazoarcus communis]